MITEEPKVFVPTGNWIQTFTGGKFYPTDPQVDDVKIRDIAHALSNQCRFAGHTRKFYSIAQHCYLVSQVCDPADALDGLLHDAAEAYMCDMPRPIKYSPGLEGFKELEKKIEAVIQKKFDLGPEPQSVKDADRRLLYTERRDLLPYLSWEGDKSTWGMGLKAEPLVEKIEPWLPQKAETMFLMRFLLLDNRRQKKCLHRIVSVGDALKLSLPKLSQK